MYQVHKVVDVQGLGNVWNKRLRAKGITTAEEMLALSETGLIGRISEIGNLPVDRFREFRRHASLMQVPGITPKYADILFRAGRKDLITLAAAKPSTIVSELKEALGKRTPATLDEGAMLNWQKRALAIHYTRKVFGVVRAGNKPVKGATVYCQNETAVTNADGKFWLPVVPFESCALLIRAKGYKTYRTVLDAGARKRILQRHSYGCDLVAAVPEPAADV